MVLKIKDLPSRGCKILYAPNVHQGGGKALLLPILDALKDKKDVLFILDERLQLPDDLVPSGKIIRARPAIAARLSLEYQLWRLVRAEMKILCMANLPPLWASSDNVTVFLQNRYLLENVPLSGFSLWVRSRIRFERWWLWSRAFRVRDFVVQTSVMRRLLNKALWRNADILPYCSLPEERCVDLTSSKKYDFLYVASGEAHKNHRTLIKAWVKMSESGKYPSLCLTLNSQKFPDLCAWIDAQRQKFGLKIEMVGELSHRGILQLYHDSKALIYPSFFESFGLPLLEAASLGLPIAAADVDYMHEMVEPTVSFDPNSPESIAASVMDFDGNPAQVVVTLVNVEKILAYML